MPGTHLAQFRICVPGTYLDISGTFVDHEYGFVYGNCTYTLAPEAGGAKILGDGKYETILRRQPDGSWKIFRDCFNSNTAP